MKQCEQFQAENNVISVEQYRHHYNVYFKVFEHKLREIRARLLKANTDYVDNVFNMFRVLKMEEASLRNSLILHQNYFNSLGQGENNISPQLLNMIIEKFGSMEEWLEEFTALARSSRGWVVLGFDLFEGKLINNICDDHPEGLWMIVPLLTLDVFEHAYQLDYGSDKEKYIMNFLDNVNWTCANNELERALKLHKNFSEKDDE